MTVSPDDGLPYQISYPAGTTRRLKSWGKVAALIGQEAAFLSALKEMEGRLRSAPAQWGEEVFDLHGMNATHFMKLGPILLVYYAVHKTHRNVFVQRIKLTPNTPLAHAVLSSS